MESPTTPHREEHLEALRCSPQTHLDFRYPDCRGHARSLPRNCRQPPPPKINHAPRPSHARKAVRALLPRGAAMTMLMIRRKAYRRFGSRLARWCGVSTLSQFIALTSRHTNWKNHRRNARAAFRNWHRARFGYNRLQDTYDAHTTHNRWGASSDLMTFRNTVLNLIHFAAQDKV